MKSLTTIAKEVISESDKVKVYKTVKLDPKAYRAAERYMIGMYEDPVKEEQAERMMNLVAKNKQEGLTKAEKKELDSVTKMFRADEIEYKGLRD